MEEEEGGDSSDEEEEGEGEQSGSDDVGAPSRKRKKSMCHYFEIDATKVPYDHETSDHETQSSVSSSIMHLGPFLTCL